MELSTDKAVAMQQIVTMFTENRDEVIRQGKDFGLRNGWVVCFADDYAAMQSNGKEIGMAVGGKLFVANSAHYANEVAINLNQKVKQVKARSELLVLPITIWSEKRAAVLQGMIDGMKQQAIAQGITL